MHNRGNRGERHRWRATWAADRVLLHVKGTGCQSFLSACGSAGIKLWSLHCAENGYAAWALGINTEQMQRLADKGGWTLEISTRSGPGRLTERICARPGVIVGGLLAVALLKLFSLFVWNIDFGAAENPDKIRRLLFDSGIVEGAVMNGQKLHQAELALQAEGENGWISLHFTEGCLFVETNALRQQEIITQDTETALYSKSEALVLSADVQSGFMAVDIGQYVAKGQLLVDNAKFGRTGNIVKQGTRGQIIGRMEKTYAATCDIVEIQRVLSGHSRTEATTYILGRKYGRQSEEAVPKEAAAFREEYWQPLRFGQLILPGCRQITTKWDIREIKVQHTTEYTEATAKRACRLQLAREFPDAIVESQEISIEKDAETVTAVCQYTLRADLTQRGAPPEHIFVKP